METAEDIDYNIINSFERISDLMRSLQWKACEPLKLSPIQANIINLIKRGEIGQVTISLLAENLKVSKPTVSDSVKTLKTKGYITEKTNPADSRSKLLVLTKSGNDIALNLGSYALALSEKLAGLYMSEKSILNNNLKDLLKKLELRGQEKSHME